MKRSENTEISKKKKVVIAGGNGFLGRMLSRAFMDKGYTVISLQRKLKKSSGPAGVKQVPWDGITDGPWSKELENAEVVINLAGRSVDCRYTNKNKKAILHSRLNATEAIGKAIQGLENRPKLWINSASATIYRHAEDKEMDEFTGEIGTGFSVDVCQQWEAMADLYQLKNTRLIKLRTAMVLGNSGGVFPVMSDLVRYNLGGKQGNGQQFISWIHEDDFIASIFYLIEQKHIEGVVNCAAPTPIRNEHFMDAMRRFRKKRIGINSPKWMLSIGAFIIRTETELVLKSRNVIPGKLTQDGFAFLYPTAEGAIENLTSNSAQYEKVGRSSFWLSFFFTIFICIAAFALLYNGWTGYGISIFCAIPIILGLTTGMLPHSGNSRKGLLVGMVCFMAFLLTIGAEGLVCLLMAAIILMPFILLGYLVAHLIKKNSHKNNIKTYASILPFLIFSGFSVIEKFMGDDSKKAYVTSTIFVPFQPEEVYDEIIHVDMVSAKKSWLHRLGLPMPINCILTEEKVGGERICEFEEGKIVEKITALERGKLLQMDVAEFDIKGRSWLSFDEDIYTFEEKENGTLVTRTTSYYSKLKPRIYWEFAENITIAAEQELVFRNLKQDLINHVGYE